LLENERFGGAIKLCLKIKVDLAPESKLIKGSGAREIFTRTGLK